MRFLAILALLCVAAGPTTQPADKTPELGAVARKVLDDVNKIAGMRPPADATTVDREKFQQSQREKINDVYAAANGQEVAVVATIVDVLPSEKFGGRYSNATHFAIATVPALSRDVDGRLRQAQINIVIAGDEKDFDGWKRKQRKVLVARIFNFPVNPGNVDDKGNIIGGAFVDNISLAMPSIP